MVRSCDLKIAETILDYYEYLYIIKFKNVINKGNDIELVPSNVQ